MSDRQTTELTTPSGKKFEVKTYITARERNTLRSVLLQNFSFDSASGQTKSGDINGELLEKSEQKAIEIAVVSFDGKTEDVLNRILDGTSDDYDFIVAEANKIANFKQPK